MSEKKSDVYRSRSAPALRVLALRDRRIRIVESGSPVGSEAYGILRGASSSVRITYSGLLGGSYVIRDPNGTVLAAVVRNDHAASTAAALVGLVPAGDRPVRQPFRYLKLYGDAGLLREALAVDLAEWISATFVAPDQSQSWQNARRRLEALTGIGHAELIDQLYADAALVLGAVDDAELLRVSEIS